MSEGALPVAEVGTRKGETPARYGRRFDFQGIGILHHGLSEPVVQGGGQKGVCPTTKAPSPDQAKTAEKGSAKES